MSRSPCVTRCILLLATLVPTLAEAAAPAGCDDLRGAVITARVDWQTQIKPLLNVQWGGRCSSCHQGSRFPDLTDAGTDAIYKILGSYVIPGDPLASGLFDKVNCDPPFAGARMPLAGAPLTTEQQGLIYDWIAQGAYGEPDGAYPRRFLFRDGAESRRWY